MSWTRRPERGSQWLMRFMARLTLALGWHVGHALLYPITAYFLLVSGQARAASRQYLAAVLGREPRLADLFHHYFTFASVILDRVFLLTGRTRAYDVQVRGLEQLQARIEAGQGCILMGAHLGSFEVLRALADQGCPVPVKVLMYEENAVRVSEVLNELNPRRMESVIRLGSTGAMLRVKEALTAGELVGMLGDRIISGDKVVTASFLGRPAILPAGPIVLASVLKAPVMLVFGIHRGPRRYEIVFEPFAERVAVNHRARQADVTAWVQRYVERLEAVCRAHPYNWFNFYDFWEGRDETRVAGAGLRGSAPRARWWDRLRRPGGPQGLDGSPLGGSGEPGQLP